MDWKSRGNTTEIEIWWENIRLNKESELPTEEMRAFIKRLVDKLLFQKRSAGLILPDNWSTHPENYDEFIALIKFSYKKIFNAWKQILWLYYIDIPFPTLTILKEHEGTLADFLWLCYMVQEEEICVDPTFMSYFQEYIYAWAEDFSIFYAMAHEFAHHIQKYLFSAIEVEYTYQREIHYREVGDILDLRVFSLHHHFDSSHQAEQIVELHADYLAGVIVHHANKAAPFLHENDIREWLETALHVWDDMMQWKKTWAVTPEKFTHGRCDQRVLAFAKWLETGDILAFTLRDITQLFFDEWVWNPAHKAVTIFAE